ncbi:cytochrome P450 3A5 [Apodospora peruviana]|uniref:Cytochrome P450 3A5 n=1 Tax=Apodospora peruviana TaxID=516989 RepID=A0AAE0I270_9PEZI|nr:cytochrome P450 3A5 [Apodospora peruviana]
MSTKAVFALASAVSLLILPPNELLAIRGLKTILALVCAQYVLQNLYRIFIYPHYLSPLRHLPGPRDHDFLIGHVRKQFAAGNPNEPYLSWVSQKWPDAPMIRYLSFLNSEVILVADIDVINEVLVKQPYAFVKPGFFQRLLLPVIGRGLLFIEGEEHVHIRRKLAAPFSMANLRKLVPVFRDKAEKLAGRIGREVGDGYEGAVVEVASKYTSATLDVIGVAVLGVELDNLDTTTPFHECYGRIFDPGPIGQIMMGLNALVPVRWIPVKENRLYKEATHTIDREVRKVIRERMSEFEAGQQQNGGKGKTERRDLLTFMLEEDVIGPTASGAREEGWTEKNLLDHMMTFLAAGHETTATALTWATYVLTQHPDVQECLHVEIRDLLKEHPTPGYSEIEGLKQLNNFCRELLRVYTPSIELPRQTAQDIVLKGMAIPKGTTIVVMPTLIHHHPRIWGEDASEFKPERWDRPGIDPHAMITFSAGSRNCIGKVFAMLELKILLVELLRKFRFEAVGKKEKVELVNPGPLLKPKGGLKVRVVKATNKSNRLSFFNAK